MIQRLLKETITHWDKSGNDGWNESSFDAPSTLTGRWQDRNEEFTNALGKESISNSIVYLSSTVSVGDYLYLGTSTAADPDNVSGASEVKKVGKVSNISNNETLVKVWL